MDINIDKEKWIELSKLLDLWFYTREEKYRENIILIYLDCGATSEIIEALYMLLEQDIEDIKNLI